MTYIVFLIVIKLLYVVKMKNEKAVMIIYACMKIISLFLGPFLVAYFVSVSLENIYSLSIFNMLNYLFLCYLFLE